MSMCKKHNRWTPIGECPLCKQEKKEFKEQLFKLQCESATLESEIKDLERENQFINEHYRNDIEYYQEEEHANK